jgi:hypothetical protein
MEINTISIPQYKMCVTEILKLKTYLKIFFLVEIDAIDFTCTFAGDAIERPSMHHVAPRSLTANERLLPRGEHSWKKPTFMRVNMHRSAIWHAQIMK